MKQTKLLLTTIVVLLCSVMANAHDFEVDGIFYNILSTTDLTVEVTNPTSPSSTAYNGDVIIPSKVTYNNCTYNVTSIGEDAFYYCTSLISIRIPSSVTNIGTYAFYNCSSLTSITIPNSVSSIGMYVFCNCTSLISISIPNSVTNIGNGTFNSCTFTKENFINNSSLDAEENDYWGAEIVDIEIDGLLIRNDSVIDCRPHVVSITIPNNVKSIGDRAFSGCSSLTSITISNSVTNIGNSAFSNCISLTSVTFPNSVISIGPVAFNMCSSLTTITIPNSVTNIGMNAFSGCTLLRENFVNNSSLNAEEHDYWGAEIADREINGLLIRNDTLLLCRSNAVSVTIPNNVTSIGTYAFYNCSSLTSITIPNCVTSIGGSAFSKCSSLNSISIPNSVTNIGSYAFSGCLSLTSISLPNNIPSIGTHTFNECKSLGSITIPNSVTSIGNYAFYNCTSLASITIPNNVTSIGTNAFYNCSSLTSVAISNSVTNIEENAFKNSGIYNDKSNWNNNVLYISNCLIEANDSISGKYTITDNTQLIANGAFKNCQFLTSISLPNNIPSIGAHTFNECKSLGSITIPNSVTSIGNYAFSGCFSLTSITIPDSVTSLGESAFSKCESLTSIVIGNSVTSIDKNAFFSCSSLTSVTIGNSVTSIGKGAFSLCTSLASVSIGNSVKSIGEHAFYYCQQLNTIYVEAVNPPLLAENTFDGCKIKHCYIPCGCVRKYLYDTTNQGWYLLLNEQPFQIESIEEYDPLLTFGNCGENIEWNYVNNKLSIIGTGEMLTYYDEDHIDYYGPNECNPWSWLSDSIKIIEIAEGVTSIGSNAFRNCSQLDSIILPSTLEWIGDNAFRNCGNLKSIMLPSRLKETGYSVFRNCTSLISVKMSNSLTRIEESTFANCSCLTEITIPNSVNTIGYAAFEDCVRLGKVQIGSGVETIAKDAFAGCTRLYDVYCYATYPPFAEQSSFANYNVYLYVPCESIRNYTLDVVWGNFKFIECIESEDVTTEGVVVTPSTNDVTITWPTEAGADSYTIVIKKGDEVFCTLTFNADGQLLNIAFAPGRNGNHPAQYAEQAGNGYRFTVTGLEEGTHYTYNIDVKNAANNTIMSHSGEFTTESTTAVENTHSQSSTSNCQKIIRNDQLLILRDGKTYTVMGQEL